MALRYIGKSPGATPVNTPVVTIITPVATEITPVVTIPVVVKTVPVTEEVSRQSPGFGTIFTVGIISIMYMLGKLLSRKDDEI